MSAVSTLITAAYREGNLIPIGKSPTAAEQTEALDRYNALLFSVIGQEMGVELSDWMVPMPQRTAPVAANYPQLPYPQNEDTLILSTPSAQDAFADVYKYPPKNSRIVFGSVTNTVYFPECPDDGSRMAIIQGSGAGDGGEDGAVLTLDGNGRTIEGYATQEYTAPITAREWLYRADLADWVVVSTQALTDDCLFPSALDDVWICGLAIRLCPRYSKTASPETLSAYAQAMRHLKARYKQAATTTFGSQNFPRAYQSYIRGRWMS